MIRLRCAGAQNFVAAMTAFERGAMSQVGGDGAIGDWGTYEAERAVALTIREFEESDWPGVWRVLEPAFRAGESYPCAIDISEAESRRYWIDAPPFTFVAFDETGTMAGTYYLRPDQGGLGDHICNCGYVVAVEARGRGVAVEMCRHSQEEARRRGFLGMKFNLVVSTNEAAIRAWKKSGFKIIGTTPKAFRHARLGLVDAHIMYKDLASDR